MKYNRTIKEPPIPGSFKKEDYERAVKAALNSRLVKCSGCGKDTAYVEPYSEDEQLCDDCMKIILKNQGKN